MCPDQMPTTENEAYRWFEYGGELICSTPHGDVVVFNTGKMIDPFGWAIVEDAIERRTVFISDCQSRYDTVKDAQRVGLEEMEGRLMFTAQKINELNEGGAS